MEYVDDLFLEYSDKIINCIGYFQKTLSRSCPSFEANILGGSKIQTANFLQNAQSTD